MPDSTDTILTVFLCPSRQMLEQNFKIGPFTSFPMVCLSNTYHKKLTPWSRVLLEKLTVTQLVKKFPAFYGTPKFIAMFTRACHWSYPESE
jgi:hypothetical protein